MNNAPRPQMMRWFTSEWHTGQLSDADHNAALRDYQEHFTSLVSARAEVGELAALNLHDGQVRHWSLDQGRFHWRLLIGDKQVGYEFVDVTYSDAQLVGIEADELTASRIEHRDLDLVSDELDEALDGHFEHRFYFWDGPTFGVRFRSARAVRVPATDVRRYARPAELAPTLGDRARNAADPTKGYLARWFKMATK